MGKFSKSASDFIPAKTIAASLLVLFCLFRYDRFHSPRPAYDTSLQQTCEQVETALPWYETPLLLVRSIVEAPAPFSASGHSPPPEYFRCIEREFTTLVSLRLHRNNQSFAAAARRVILLLHTRVRAGNSDDPPALFFS
jgi:hypothetical protein